MIKAGMEETRPRVDYVNLIARQKEAARVLENLARALSEAQDYAVGLRATLSVPSAGLDVPLTPRGEEDYAAYAAVFEHQILEELEDQRIDFSPRDATGIWSIGGDLHNEGLEIDLAKVARRIFVTCWRNGWIKR